MSIANVAKAVAPIPSATILLLRDGADGLEVFMVKRHHQIDFASGALVFPGGKVDPGDRDPALAEWCDGAEHWTGQGLGYPVAAIREAFEECGVLLARQAGDEAILSGKQLKKIQKKYRAPIAAGDISIIEMVSEQDLTLACDVLVPFAHWVTPTIVVKRFETKFFVVRVPEGHVPKHDGSESVDSLWVRPADALAMAESGEAVIVFPTRLNLEKLGHGATVEEALERARVEPIVTVQPAVIQEGGEVILRIPPNAGYDTIEGPVDPVLKKMKARNPKKPKKPKKAK